jgi:hypothetical protein
LALALLVAEHVWGDAAFAAAARGLSQMKYKTWQALAKEETRIKKLGIYDGEKCMDGKRHGRGRCQYLCGGVYDGDWVQGKKHGQGKWIFNQGRVYEGAWENDQRHGMGSYIDSKWTFTGEFEHGKPVDQAAFDRARGE